MSRILIKGVLLQGSKKDILIENNIIAKIADCIDSNSVEGSVKVIDGKDKAVIPGLVNMHTHSGMTLFRGVCEDKPLMEWLGVIWEMEPRLDEELIYWGTKLACLEMIKTGTTCFNDQYWMIDSAVKAVSDMGLRSHNTYVFLDLFDEAKAAVHRKECMEIFSKSRDWSELNTFGVAIHGEYTNSVESIKWTSDFARKNDLLVHIHLSESEKENADRIAKSGVTPTKYFQSLGVLGPEVLAAHCVWINDEDMAILAENDVKIVHNINSNLKLASGYTFKYKEFKEAGLTVSLGTDGNGSSNNLDMLEAMKTTALMQKAWRKDPTAMPLDELLDTATINGARSLRLNNGKIEEGALADLVLVDINNYAFTPNYDFLANLVYSANSSCVDTVICNGKVLMEGRIVEGEQEILDRVNSIYRRLM